MIPATGFLYNTSTPFSQVKPSELSRTGYVSCISLNDGNEIVVARSSVLSGLDDPKNGVGPGDVEQGLVQSVMKPPVELVFHENETTKPAVEDASDIDASNGENWYAGDVDLLELSKALSQLTQADAAEQGFLPSSSMPGPDVGQSTFKSSSVRSSWLLDEPVSRDYFPSDLGLSGLTADSTTESTVQLTGPITSDGMVFESLSGAEYDHVEGSWNQMCQRLATTQNVVFSRSQSVPCSRTGIPRRLSARERRKTSFYQS